MDHQGQKFALPISLISEHRPWGHFITLAEGPGYKTKKLVLLPGKRLSLQRHEHRAEHWLVVSGQSVQVTVGKLQRELCLQQTVWIFKGEVHRAENTGTDSVVIIETQFGAHLDEDDIVRLEDDFGRA